MNPGKSSAAPVLERANAAKSNSASPAYQRRFPHGAELMERGGTHFRVWAPRSRRVFVQLGKTSGDVESGSWAVELHAEADGYFSGLVAEADAGLLYKYRLDSGCFPDPASRFQPEGPHGASQIIDPRRFKWSDGEWKGLSREGQVIYEQHIGTFTQSGTFQEAIGQLAELQKIGITAVEVMPVADFPGKFGWGYDGVNLFAPTRLYGRPDDFRAFIDRAHSLGLGVILDVVYNHFGPDGNYLGQFSEDFKSGRYENEWGDALNFDGENSGPVREFFSSNAAYWIEEFHIDGLRLDATHQIYDCSDRHILAEIAEKVRAAARGRKTFLICENESQHTRLVRPESDGGYGLDALWNDDFHHIVRVLLTGHNEAYYMDYTGTPQEFISSAKWGYVYQGQYYKWQKKRRGTPALDLSPVQFINYIENHDQISNSLLGLRLHQLSDAATHRAMTALLLLSPQTPMLFQGQEFAASAPFLYFADHNPELARLVDEGRKKFLCQFPSIAAAVNELSIASDEKTFLRCKLDFSERTKNSAIYQMHRDLLRLRREDAVFSKPRARGLDGAVLGPHAFVLRYFGDKEDDRLLIVNFGVEQPLDPAPEPLLAPMAGCVWETIWTSDDPRYGGLGTPELERNENWKIPGKTAVVLAPKTLPRQQKDCAT